MYFFFRSSTSDISTQISCGTFSFSLWFRMPLRLSIGLHGWAADSDSFFNGISAVDEELSALQVLVAIIVSIFPLASFVIWLVRWNSSMGKNLVVSFVTTDDDSDRCPFWFSAFDLFILLRVNWYTHKIMRMLSDVSARMLDYLVFIVSSCHWPDCAA